MEGKARQPTSALRRAVNFSPNYLQRKTFFSKHEAETWKFVFFHSVTSREGVEKLTRHEINSMMPQSKGLAIVPDTFKSLLHISVTLWTASFSLDITQSRLEECKKVHWPRERERLCVLLYSNTNEFIYLGKGMTHAIIVICVWAFLAVPNPNTYLFEAKTKHYFCFSS